MELQNLSYLVHGYENAIKELTEKKNILSLIIAKIVALRMESGTFIIIRKVPTMESYTRLFLNVRQIAG